MVPLGSAMDNDDTPVGRILTRREVLALFGVSVAAACAPSALTSASPSPARSADASATTPAAPVAAGTALTAPQCIAVPALTEGPYFVDEKLNRTDIRTDASGGTPKDGARFDLAIQVGRMSGGTCAALQGATVDVWHCDALGVYSDAADPSFNTKGQKWLRGYQTTDASGIARFTTVYPGWYPGRAVHIHFKVRVAQGSQTADFTSQFFFDEAMNDKVFATAPYSQKGASGRLRNERDDIFRQSNGKTQLSVTQTGSVYSATFSLGIA
jgi:protocatechuate 3,4-dioxygenase beta subunit